MASWGQKVAGFPIWTARTTESTITLTGGVGGVSAQIPIPLGCVAIEVCLLDNAQVMYLTPNTAARSSGARLDTSPGRSATKALAIPTCRTANQPPIYANSEITSGTLDFNVTYYYED